MANDDERRRRVNIPGQQGVLERAYTGARELLTPRLSPEAQRLSEQISSGPDIGQRAARAADVGLATGMGTIVQGAQAMGLEAPSPAEISRSFMGAVEQDVERLRGLGQAAVEAGRGLVPTSPEAERLIRQRRTAPVEQPGRVPAPTAVGRPGVTGARVALEPEATLAAPATGVTGTVAPPRAQAARAALAPAAAQGELDPMAIAAGQQDPGYPQIWNGRQLILVGAPPELQAQVTAAGAELERQRELESLGRAAEAASFTATNPSATPEEREAAARTLSSLAPNIAALRSGVQREVQAGPSPTARRQETAFGERVKALRTGVEEALRAARDPNLLPEEQAQQAQLAQDLSSQLVQLSGVGAAQPAALTPAAGAGVVPEPWRGQTGVEALVTQRRTSAALDEIASEGITADTVNKYFSKENDESRYLFSQLNSDQRRRILELRK